MNRLKKRVLCGIILLGLPGLAWSATGLALSNIFTIDNQSGSAGQPVVTGLSSAYCSQSQSAYFLAGVSLNQTFTATMDWNGFSASQIKWYRNSTQIAVDNVSGNVVSRSFNVGTDFNVGDRLYAQAVASDGTTSSKWRANFESVAPPPGLVAGVLFFQNGNYQSFPFNIGFPELLNDPPAGNETNTLADNSQVRWKSVLEVGAEISPHGHAEIKTGNDLVSLSKNDFKIANIGVGGNIDVVLTYDYSSGQWSPGGGFDLAVSGKYQSPPSYVVFVVGFVPVPTYYRFAVDAGVAAQLRFTGGSADLPVFSGDIPVGAGLEGMTGVGVADVLAVEGYLRGDLNLAFQLPDEPFLKDWYLSLDGGIRIFLIFYKYENNFLSYRWPEAQSTMTSGIKAMTADNFEPMSRDYFTTGYAQWQNTGGRQAMDIQQPLSAGGTETTLQSNIFGQSNAAVAVSTPTKCLVWLYDDPGRNSLDRTLLVYSLNSGSGWSAPVAVADDGTADAMPDMAVDANGNFICVWANASQLIPDGTNFSGFADKLDIQMAVYDEVVGTWTTETVTNAAAVDSNPKVVCDDFGNTTVVWTHDNNNDMLAENPPVTNTLMARTKNGAVWNAAQPVATVSGLVTYADLEINATGTHLVYCLDSDSDFQTDSDNELYYSNHTGGLWPTPVRLTNDSVADVNPQWAKTSTDLLLLWARGGQVVGTTDIAGMTGIAPAVATAGSSGQRSFVTAVSPTDNVSVVWNDPSQAGSDIYTATYDPTMLAWSAVVQMTDNRDMERSIAAVYATGDVLSLVYNKVHIIEGQDGLNSFGQVDLCVYDYPIGSDLTVNADSIIVTDPNVVPGDTAVLQATVANIGDTAISAIPVAFYQGATATPANQIGATQSISGPLAAGDETTVSVNWTIPELSEPVNVIVVIDPNLQIEDKDRLNNWASTQLFGVNLAIEQVVIDDIVGNIHLTAEIINNGFVPTPEGIVCQLTGDADPNTIIDSQSVAALEPGQSSAVVFTIPSEVLTYGFNPLKISVDPNNVLTETAKNDNQQNVLIKNTVPYDLVIDGVIDILDLNALANQWLGAAAGLTADIAPNSGDGTVNLIDFSVLVEHWQETVFVL